MSGTLADLQQAIRALDLDHRPVCLHVSLRSFGPIEGGPATVIQAFLAANCTLLVPTFSHEAFAIAPPADLRFARNGYDYGYRTSRPVSTRSVYTPNYTGLDEDMGVLPAALLAMPGHVRGDHPLNSFSAVGPQARTLIGGQRPDHVYAPLEALAEADGAVVLAGVDINRLTLLHLAEERAGRQLFFRWALGRDAAPSAVQVGGCSEGFGCLAPALASYTKHAQVGLSRWQVFRALEVLEAAAEAIRSEPAITHCADPACERCRDAIAGGPYGP